MYINWQLFVTLNASQHFSAIWSIMHFSAIAESLAVCSVHHQQVSNTYFKLPYNNSKYHTAVSSRTPKSIASCVVCFSFSLTATSFIFLTNDSASPSDKPTFLPACNHTITQDTVHRTLKQLPAYPVTSEYFTLNSQS